jgi:hypothetical protein
MEPFCVNVVSTYSNVEFVAAMYRCLILHLLAGSRVRHHRRLFRFRCRFLCPLQWRNAHRVGLGQ